MRDVCETVSRPASLPRVFPSSAQLSKTQPTGTIPRMLHTLRIKNLALVESVSIDFSPGLNVITGETGAGKSILIGALGLLLGERADKTIIRGGEEQCGAEALIEVPDPARLNALLAERGIELCDNGNIVLRRIVSTSGASRSFVNGSPTTLQALKEIGDLLVDMHGPHDHQSLLNTDYQMDILDAFGHTADLREEYVRSYREVRAIESERQAVHGADEQMVAQQIDLLSFQIQELDEAALADGEDVQIEREQAVVANAQRILELTAGVTAALTEGETSAFQALVAVQQALTQLSGILPEADEWRTEARALAVQVQELSTSVSACASKVDADPQRLQWLEERMALYHKLKHKYGATVAEVLAHLEKARARLQELQGRGQRLAELDGRLAEAAKRMSEAGRKLGRKRRTVAAKLAEAATQQLRDLGFPHGAFHVELGDVQPGPSGIDAVEFGFAPNPGEPMRPLQAIASSGEISRVMLAVKAVLSAHDRIPILVFDEIDANIGGETANAVGAKLAEVAGAHQVLCITHLPQVAVCGTTHFAVRKEVRDGRTRTDVERLDTDSRTEEIARMLGGRDLTSVTLRHARELLRRR